MSYLDIAKSAALIIAPAIGGGVGSYLTREWPRSDWYKQLKKPWFTPPNKVFAPVWTTLYGCMGYSSYLIWRDAAKQGVDATLPLALYGTQLAINWIWSPIFFNRKDYATASVSILTMAGAVAGCIYLFHPINPTASYLLVPYLAWLSLASSLTVYIWRNNAPAVAKYRRTLLGRPIAGAEGDKQE